MEHGAEKVPELERKIKELEEKCDLRKEDK